MEKNYWEKSKSFAKAAALSGAMALSPEAVSQTNGDWGIVSENEITRRNISESDIQTIDLRKNEEYEVDNSKSAIRFIDKGGNQAHYWINNNPIKNELIIETLNSSGDMLTSDTLRWNDSSEAEDETHEESDEEKKERVYKIKEEVSKVVEDLEIKEAFEKFQNEFFLAEPYAIDPRYPDKIFNIKHHNLYKNPSDEMAKHESSVLIVDKKQTKVVELMDDTPDFSSSLANFLIYTNEDNFEGLKDGLFRFLQWNEKLDLSLEEKIKFLKPYFTTKIEEALRGPEYNPPIIIQPEYIDDYKEALERDKKRHEVLDEVEPPQRIKMDNEKLKDLLDDN